ncbi:lipoprotein [Caballeronia hypogeia]|uniref:Lipoprotein n=1 Tax=Caballeronia hypogeia TaxID=1777140 RepID=A0A158B2U2_9BURK|nr:hypothetical protein [Caballeronia hypogeia]SAK63617.1 lipoprotein [Caballeronia hypogeia]
MPHIVVSFVCAAFLSLGLSACADSSTSHKHPPQDPPDYKGVPTDMTPPSMLDAPVKPQ